MRITEIPSSGEQVVACSCGELVVVVDRYITDFPPGPRGATEAQWEAGPPTWSR